MSIKIYLVGGAVRDQLLGCPVHDRDWVVVGATPQVMCEQGYLPVGKDFPVFLHPETHEEYALARTERKTGAGYKGFQVYAAEDVSLEEDLARRDLTINAMAMDQQTGELIDPYHGQTDLSNGILRHVSCAFVEDPVRILRTARFAARYHFAIAPETRLLMQKMVVNGEVDALVPERVWQELSKGLMEQTPSLMFQVLSESGALIKVLPEIDELFFTVDRQNTKYGTQTLQRMDTAARMNLTLPERFATMVLDLGKIRASVATPKPTEPDLLTALNRRLKLPADCHDLAKIVIREHSTITCVVDLSTEDVLALLIRCDAIRRPERFTQVLNVCLSDDLSAVKNGQVHESMPNIYWKTALKAALSVNAGQVAQSCTDKSLIPQEIFYARCEAIRSIDPIEQGIII